MFHQSLISNDLRTHQFAVIMVTLTDLGWICVYKLLFKVSFEKKTIFILFTCIIGTNKYVLCWRKWKIILAQMNFQLAQKHPIVVCCFIFLLKANLYDLQRQIIKTIVVPLFIKQVLDLHFVHRVRFRLLIKFLVIYFVHGTIYDLHIITW